MKRRKLLLKKKNKNERYIKQESQLENYISVRILRIVVRYD
jgi:hypothetical protein